MVDEQQLTLAASGHDSATTTTLPAPAAGMFVTWYEFHGAH